MVSVKLIKKEGEVAKLDFSSGKVIPVDLPVEYGGDPSAYNPVELLIAATNSCLALTFFHFAKNSGIELIYYEGDAEGKVEKTEAGKKVTHIKVEGRFKAKERLDAEKIRNFENLVEKFCTVSNSLAATVEFSLEQID